MDTLTQKFFSDPDWSKIEEMLMTKINALKDFESIDTNQSAETVKAEVIGRRIAYNSLIDFLNETKIVGRIPKKIENPFK